MGSGWQERLPARGDLVRVFAASAFIVYSWTMFISFWKLPSWLYFLNLGEIFSIYAYGFLFNLLECLLLVGLASGISLLLPRAWWRDAFVSKGGVLTLAIIASMQVHLSRFPTHGLRDPFLASQALWWLMTFLLIVFLAWCAGKFIWLKKILETVADRLTIFLYIYLPLTAVSLVVVAARMMM